MHKLQSLLVRGVTGLILVFLAVFVVSLVNQGTVLAQCADRAKDGSAILQQTNLPTTGCGSSTDTLTRIVRFVFAVMAMIALLFVVVGGFKYVISGGDSNAIASAKKTITYAVLGLVIGLSVFLITGYIINQVPTR